MTDDKTIRQLFPELAKIKNKLLSDRVVATWVRVWCKAGIGDRINEIPFYYQTPQESLIEHVRKVTKFALALATSLPKNKSTPVFDPDILLAACLLHDVDKLLMYELTKQTSTWQPSSKSRKFLHGHLGAIFCHEAGLPEILVHIVASHSSRSPVSPEPFEGVILHYADFFAADTILWKAGKRLLLER